MKSIKIIVAGCIVPLFAFLTAVPCVSAQRDTEKPTLYWIHKDTGRIVFTIEDIVAFDWERQMFQLKKEAAMDMMLYPDGLIDPFEVCTNDALIYKGAFVSSLSSIPYSGPTILDTNHNLSCLYSIQAGYPTAQALPQDARNNETLKHILEQAKLLKAIDPNNPTESIQCKNYGWLGEKSGLRVWLDLFADTFVPNKPARFHFRLASNKKYTDGDYVIETQTTLTANDGQFVRTLSRSYPVRQKYLLTTHPVGFILFNKVSNGQVMRIQPGSAQIQMNIAIRQVIDPKTNTCSEPLETLKTEPVTITILSNKRNVLSPDAQTAMENFRQALRNEDWSKALMFCSESSQQKAKTMPLNSFFKTYIPLYKFIGNGDLFISSTTMGTANRQISVECGFIVSEPNEIPDITWVCNLKKDESNEIWTMDFPLITISEQMKQKRAKYSAEREKSRKEQEQWKKTLKTTLVPLQQDYVVGKPMLFSLEVTNTSNSSITRPYFTKSLMVNNPLSVKGPDGKEVLYIGGSAQTGGGPKEFAPGQTEIVIVSYDATTQYLITTGGKYTFQFRGHFLTASEEVPITVKDGALGPRENITLKLLSILPDDWGISVYSSPQLSNDTKTHLNLRFFMDTAGSGFYGITSLSVFIDPDDDILTRYKNQAHQFKLTQSPWGPVYVLQKNVDSFWPDYRESLTRALSFQ